MVDGRTVRVCDYYGSKNPNSKLTEKQVICIRDFYEQGATPTGLARIFQTSRSNISNIVAGRTWGHLNQEVVNEKESEKNREAKGGE